MNLAKVDLIIHPVRLRVLQALLTNQLTTQQLAAQLPDIPPSSIYRHLKLLLAGNLIDIAHTQLVNGIQEKTYRLAPTPHFKADAPPGLTADDHLHTLLVFMLTTLQGFTDYFQQADSTGSIDSLASHAGFTETIFWATRDELDAFQAALQQALRPLHQNPPANDRHQHKVTILSHPL